MSPIPDRTALRAFALFFAAWLVAACSGAPAEAAPSPDDAAATAEPAGPPPGAEFLPADYEGELFADFAAMRDCGLLDRLERLPMMTQYLDVIGAQFGCGIDDLLQVRTAVVFPPTRDGQGGGVSVATVASTSRATPHKAWQATAIGPFTGWRVAESSLPKLMFWPREGTAVQGEEWLLAPLIGAERTAPGGPCPALQPLLRGNGVLMQYAFFASGRPMHVHTGTIGFPASWEGGDDPPELGRIRVVRDRDDVLTLSFAVWFRHGKDGLRRVETSLREAIAETLAKAELAPLHPLIRDIVVTHGSRDLTASLRLGTPREAVSRLERAALAAMAAGSSRR